MTSDGQSAFGHLDPQEAEAGDAACWLGNVCPGCGALVEHPDRPCWRCGGPVAAGDPD